jgi:hypothetical protein
MTLAELTEVWTPLSLAVAIISGLLVGILLVGRFASDPAYASGDASPLEYALVTVVMTAAAGLIFYGGQIMTSYIGGDTAWTRVVSRYGIWIAYAAAIGLGTWIRLHRHLRRKHAEIHDRAISQLADDS